MTMTSEDNDKKSGKILITSALPYANGPIHIGHLVEYIQTDIFARFLKLIGKDAIYCCADDTHGTPIQISAMKEGVTPEQIIDKYHKEHLQDFTDFLINFDSYHSTNSPENKKFAEYIFEKLKEKGLIYQKDMELTYCKKCARFLPDRYVKGKCPKCDAVEQYGDVCEKCNATYETTDLIEPFCTICGAAPIRKISKHYFFKLGECADDLKKWLESNKKMQPEVKNYVLNWIKDGLDDWCISRDGPYFGFKIPGEDDKYFYVWLDAPIGYIASTANYAKKNKVDIDDYWKRGEIIHFIGKDITYFHFLFWPAVLMNSGFVLPKNIVVHGFLTVNKEEMSKSRGTFITAKEFLEVLGPQYLRFYYAANLTHTMTDIDLDIKDFKARINNELVADLGNFEYRALSFINKNFDSMLSEIPEDKKAGKLIVECNQKFKEVKKAYEAYNFREAVKIILEIGSIGNKYFQEAEPWKMVHESEEKKQEAQKILTLCANLAKDISILMKPILPLFSSQIEDTFGVGEQTWDDLNFELKNIKIKKAEILIQKLQDEPEKLIAPVENDKKKDIDPFAKLDLRIATIKTVEKHPDADKLFIETIDLGKKLGERQIISGLAPYYKPEELEGKNIIVVANLKPAKMRGIMSEGMLLAGEKGDDIVKVLEAPYAKPGDKVYVEGIESHPVKELDFKDFTKAKLKIVNHEVQYKGKILKVADGDTITCEEIDDGIVG